MMIDYALVRCHTGTILLWYWKSFCDKIFGVPEDVVEGYMSRLRVLVLCWPGNEKVQLVFCLIVDVGTLLVLVHGKKLCG
jgi:hypothetical protein